MKTARLKDRAEELYQEFFLSLCEIKDNRLVEAFEGNYLPYFCYGIICNLWANKDRVKRYENGKTSTLHYMSDTNIVVEGKSVDEFYSTEIDIEGDIFTEEEYDPEIDELSEQAVKQVEQDMNSEDRDIHFRSTVFYYTHFTCKNPREFHRKTGIPYRVVRESYQMYKQRLNKICSQHLSL